MGCRKSHLAERVPLGAAGDGARRLRRFRVRQPTGHAWLHGLFGYGSGLKSLGKNVAADVRRRMELTRTTGKSASSRRRLRRAQGVFTQSVKVARRSGARRLSIVANVRAETARTNRSPPPSPREARTGRGPGRGVLHHCERPHPCGAPPLPGPLLHSEWRRGRRRPRCGRHELSHRMIRSKSGGRDGGVGFIGRFSAVRTALRCERRAPGAGSHGAGHGPVDGLLLRWRRGEGVGGELSGD